MMGTSESINPAFIQRGLWSQSEHQRFYEGTRLYRNDWVRVSNFVGTRIPKQIRWHANELRKKAKCNPESVSKELIELLTPERDAWSEE